jgi:serine/threonine protein kinase, bacterial
MFKNLLLLGSNLLEKPIKNLTKINERYSVVDFLGRGSYGNSYLVYDEDKQVHVVLKTLRFHKRIFKSGIQSFEDEQKLLQSLEHPFFPKYFENGTYGKIPYFTMEYVAGKTFEDLIFQENKRYDEIEAFQITGELLTILSWLHERCIVHRDVRIPNVMLVNNRLRLIDFGLARSFKKGISTAINRDKIKREVSPISDFYALGHFLLFLLYSTYEHNEDVKEKSWEDELDISIDAKKIIRKLLAIDEPYQSSNEIKADFDKVLSLGRK